MKIVMCSNYLNHHQLPMAQAFCSQAGTEYTFIATSPFNRQRTEMGYRDENREYDFVVRAYESAEEERKAHALFREADIAMIGSAPDSYMAERLESGLRTFRT